MVDWPQNCNYYYHTWSSSMQCTERVLICDSAIATQYLGVAPIAIHYVHEAKVANSYDISVMICSLVV